MTTTLTRWFTALVLASGGILQAQSILQAQISGPADTAGLPDAPTPQVQEKPAIPETRAGLQKPILIYVYPGRITSHRLTAGDKWKLYSRDTFGPRSLLTPTIGAAIRLANPPDRYPEEWEASLGGFGRQYGNGLAIQGARNTAYYGVAGLLHEDPRYAPSTSRNVLMRTGHALFFTFVDKGDSGASRPAIANFAGALAGGFIGNAYLPAGFNDATHAGQRSLQGLANYGGTNLLREFTPEMLALINKFHIKQGGVPIPVWWVREKPAKP